MAEDNKKQKLADAFDKASVGYDNPGLRYFLVSARHMVSDMCLEGSENLLDVATGTGHVALTAARLLSEGSVTGVDISEGMLERAQEKADALNLKNIIFKCCDIEDMGFVENKFDLASCAFGLFFLPDMEKGLRSIVRAIKPGGRLYLTSFREGFIEPMRGMLLSRLNTYGIATPELSSMRLDRPEKIREILLNIDLTDVNIQTRQLGYYIKDGREWMDLVWNTAFRAPLGQFSETDLKRFTDDHVREVDGLRGEDGIWLNIEVIFAESRKLA